MNSSYNPYAVSSVAEASIETRTDFVRKTYLHLAGAIGLFALLETLLIQMGMGAMFVNLLGGSRFSWLMVLGAFMGVSYLANSWAYNGASKGKQYAGLILYTCAEAVIFLPLIMLATRVDPSAIGKAGVVTGFMVLGLTAIAFTTKKPWSPASWCWASPRSPSPPRRTSASSAAS